MEQWNDLENHVAVCISKRNNDTILNIQLILQVKICLQILM